LLTINSKPDFLILHIVFYEETDRPDDNVATQPPGKYLCFIINSFDSFVANWKGNFSCVAGDWNHSEQSGFIMKKGSLKGSLSLF